MDDDQTIARVPRPPIRVEKEICEKPNLLGGKPVPLRSLVVSYAEKSALDYPDVKIKTYFGPGSSGAYVAPKIGPGYGKLYDEAVLRRMLYSRERGALNDQLRRKENELARNGPYVAPKPPLAHEVTLPPLTSRDSPRVQSTLPAAFAHQVSQRILATDRTPSLLTTPNPAGTTPGLLPHINSNNSKASNGEGGSQMGHNIPALQASALLPLAADPSAMGEVAMISRSPAETIGQRGIPLSARPSVESLFQRQIAHHQRLDQHHRNKQNHQLQQLGGGPPAPNATTARTKVPHPPRFPSSDQQRTSLGGGSTATPSVVPTHFTKTPQEGPTRTHSQQERALQIPSEAAVANPVAADGGPPQQSGGAGGAFILATSGEGAASDDGSSKAGSPLTGNKVQPSSPFSSAGAGGLPNPVSVSGGGSYTLPHLSQHLQQQKKQRRQSHHHNSLHMKGHCQVVFANNNKGGDRWPQDEE